MLKKYVITLRTGDGSWRPGLFVHEEVREAIGEALMEIDAAQRTADPAARYRILPPERVGKAGWRLVGEPLFAGGYPQPIRVEALILPIEISEAREEGAHAAEAGSDRP